MYRRPPRWLPGMVLLVALVAQPVEAQVTRPRVGARVAVDELAGDAGGGLRRVRRRFVARIPRRFVFVARCEETIDDPLACRPPS